MTVQIDFFTLDAALRRAETGLEAAECHGTLCGVICAQRVYDPTPWLNDVLASCDPADDDVRDLRQLLLALGETAVNDLNDPDYGFQPLLPSDDEPLQARTLAISQWCQGYLQGLRLGGVPHPEKAEGNAGEIVRDLIEIGKAGRFQVNDSDENEADFAELVEYLRAGVRLIYEELRATAASPQPQHSATTH